MWWKIETVRVGKRVFDLWCRKASIFDFGFQWSERSLDTEKNRLVQVKPSTVAYTSITEAFASFPSILGIGVKHEDEAA